MVPAYIVRTGVLVALLALPAAAQIPDVSVICRNRPIVTGDPRTQGARARPTPRADPTAEPAGPGRSASDLFCIDLFSTAAGGDAVGVIELARARSPFGVSVNALGYQVHDLTAWIANLPDPRTLGEYTVYVAWATPLVLDPVRKLGVLTDGANPLGLVDFNKFMILVTAEASADVTERTGPLILRGRSPSSKMEAHDLLALAPIAAQGPRAMPARTGTAAGEWTMPPVYDGVPMLPGMMGVRPRVGRLDPMQLADVDTLPAATPRQLIDLPNGGTLDLRAGFVRRRVGVRELVLLGFNGQIPGPLVRVTQASTIFVNFTNDTPFPTAVHWHGLRLDNRFRRRSRRPRRPRWNPAGVFGTS